MPVIDFPISHPCFLTARERQIIALVSQGYKNRELAEMMFISEHTVKHHLRNIFAKLGLSGRLQVALYGIFHNIQPPERNLSPQVGVIAPHPVFPDGRKDVHGDTILQGLDAMRNVRRDA